MPETIALERIDSILVPQTAEATIETCQPTLPKCGPMQRLRHFWRRCPRWLRYGLVGYLAAFALIVAFIPGNEWDCMTSYLTRIFLEKCGPLRQTATLEHEFVFPKFFDYSHARLLRLGYFTTLPSFALFLAVLFVLLTSLKPQRAVIAIFMVFATAPILAGATGLKNDLAVGCFAFLAAWAAVYVTNPHFYLPTVIGFCCALVGTKWLGLVLAAPILGYALYRCAREQLWSRWARVWLVLLAPVFWYVSSASVYLHNIRDFHALTPTFPGLADPSRTSSVPHNVLGFLWMPLIEQLTPVWFALDIDFNGALWQWFSRHTPFSMPFGSWQVYPTSSVPLLGWVMLITLVGCFLTLFRRASPRAERMLAAFALFYAAALLFRLEYSARIDRYFIPTILLGVIPTVRQIQSCTYFRIARPVLVVLALVTSMQVLLLDQERNLVPLLQWQPETKQTYVSRSVWPDLKDRDMLYFHVWGGYCDIFDSFRKEVHREEKLLILNGGLGEDVPYLLPFLRNRPSGTTAIHNARCEPDHRIRIAPDKLRDFDFVMAYNYAVPPELASRLELFYECPPPYAMKLYRVSPNRSAVASLTP